MVLKAALELAEGLLCPNFQEMDKNPPEFIEDQIKVHLSVKPFLKKCGEGGWIGTGIPFEWGGQQLPQMITQACTFIFAAANYSASAYPGLTSGAARLILNFGREEMKRTYLPKMLSGKWQGTMALTEPEAGSSLSDITAGYFLHFGTIKADFLPQKTSTNARGEYTLPAKVEATVNLSIVRREDGDETFAGAPLNKFYRIDTVPLIDRNFSTASAALALFRLELPSDADGAIAALESLSGLETDVPIFCTLRGRNGSGPLKGRNDMETADGRRKYYDEAMFRLNQDDVALSVRDYAASGGGWASTGYLVDGEFTLTRPSDNVEHVVVFTDLEPTPFAWKVKRSMGVQVVRRFWGEPAAEVREVHPSAIYADADDKWVRLYDNEDTNVAAIATAYVISYEVTE